MEANLFCGFSGVANRLVARPVALRELRSDVGVFHQGGGAHWNESIGRDGGREHGRLGEMDSGR